MTTKQLPTGVVHNVPSDLKRTLVSNPDVLEAWEDITPLARNEWICWVEEAKKPETRARRIKRTSEELAEGQRRPCCWAGCPHRTDKKLSPSQKFVYGKQSKSK